MARADKNSVNEYLLGRLTESDEEQVELRLLTDPEFAEEYDIVVNEIVDDYVGGKFGGEDLKQVEDYFFKHPERRSKLKFALALKQRKSEIIPSPAPVPRQVEIPPDYFIKKHAPSWYRPYLAIAASLVLAIGGYYIWSTLSDQSDLNKGLVALRTAFKDERSTEARLSDFNYAPLPNQRGGPTKVDYVQRDLAANLLHKVASERPSATSHHALGQYYLAERQFDKAIDQFTAALTLNPNNAKIYSDLGAAWFAKAAANQASGNPAGQEMLDRGLTNLNKALELDPALPEAIFNRALVYENLARRDEANRDWQKYLQLDSASPWAVEARQHIKQ